MSDFDKEAERERLREKYERDEEKRQVTERMSELLLKGATMTNAHCQDCGDPIFRYDGQEFCATCQKTVSRAPSEDDDEEGEEIEVATPEDTRVQFGGETTQQDQDETSATEETAKQRDAADAEPTVDGATERADAGREAGTDATSPARDEATPLASDSTVQSASETGEGADLAVAEASLTRTTAALAQSAEAAEDISQKRALLGATREAAEALAAVRSATR